jgi:hypothetical protein
MRGEGMNRWSTYYKIWHLLFALVRLMNQCYYYSNGDKKAYTQNNGTGNNDDLALPPIHSTYYYDALWGFYLGCSDVGWGYLYKINVYVILCTLLLFSQNLCVVREGAICECAVMGFVLSIAAPSRERIQTQKGM